MPQSCRSEMGLPPNDGLIRPKYPRDGNTPFKNDFCDKIGPALPRCVGSWLTL